MTYMLIRKTWTNVAKIIKEIFEVKSKMKNIEYNINLDKCFQIYSKNKTGQYKNKIKL